jgi:outer membrane protein assembly factor BamB
MRRIRWVLAALVLVAFAAVPTLARAATVATLSVSPTSAPAGATLTAKGAHFTGGESVDLSVDGTKVATAKASSGGSFSGKHLTIPASVKPGKHTVRVIGRTSHRSAKATVTVVAPADWAQLRAGPTHTAANPAETVLTPATVGGLKLRWSLDGPGISTGAEVGGVGYWFLNGQVTAFDPVTGAVRWHVGLGTGTGASSALTVGGGRIFLGTNKGGLVALNTADGTTAWTRTIDVNSIASAPTLADGVLYAMGDDQADRNQVYALDPATGATRWQTQIEGGVSTSSVTVSGGLVFVCAGVHNQLYALDTATGTVRWHATVVSGGYTPFAANGFVYTVSGTIAGGAFPEALDPATGAVRWIASEQGFTLAVTDRAVYATRGVATDPEHPLDQLVALDAHTGAQLWVSPKLGGGDRVGVVAAGGVVYVNDAHLYALDAASGKLLWTGSSDGLGDFVVVNGEVLVPVRNTDFTTTLRAYRL